MENFMRVPRSSEEHYNLRNAALQLRRDMKFVNEFFVYIRDEGLIINSIGRISTMKHYYDIYYTNSGKATSVGYYRGGKKDKEIDIVVEYPKFKNILIEVKYRDAAPISDNEAISLLCEESSASIIVTKSPTDFGVHNTKSGFKMLRIPAFAFLYLL